MYELDRFIKAQNRDYDTALNEIKEGYKRSHWMWYIFPQIIGLGRSEIAVYYSIADREEAECYMQNDLLRGHLLEISEALLQVESDDATRVMGFPDDMKLQSCMTLFAHPNMTYSRRSWTSSFMERWIREHWRYWDNVKNSLGAFNTKK